LLDCGPHAATVGFAIYTLCVNQIPEEKVKFCLSAILKSHCIQYADVLALSCSKLYKSNLLSPKRIACLVAHPEYATELAYAMKIVKDYNLAIPKEYLAQYKANINIFSELFRCCHRVGALTSLEVEMLFHSLPVLHACQNAIKLLILNDIFNEDNRLKVCSVPQTSESIARQIIALARMQQGLGGLAIEKVAEKPAEFAQNTINNHIANLNKIVQDKSAQIKSGECRNRLFHVVLAIAEQPKAATETASSEQDGRHCIPKKRA
jgi:hypothetical protein